MTNGVHRNARFLPPYIGNKVKLFTLIVPTQHCNEDFGRSLRELWSWGALQRCLKLTCGLGFSRSESVPGLPPGWGYVDQPGSSLQLSAMPGGGLRKTHLQPTSWQLGNARSVMKGRSRWYPQHPYRKHLLSWACACPRT